MERVSFRNVSKQFSYNAGRHLLRGHLREWLHPAATRTFFALRDVSFTVRDGDGLAVIGANGAGKSTLLNLATQLCRPDEGTTKLNGRVAPLLELGSGFHGDLTGDENLRINASILGLSRKRTREMYNSIVDFSGLGEYMDQPLRTYSTGMVMRLAFSIAMHADPDILMIDEVIAVGDQGFQAKCFERLVDFRRAGKTMLCASHSPAVLREMCNQAIWLDKGRIVAHGQLDEVLELYERDTPALQLSH
jgi:ABC-type polysaccharide/polyol phosphate transport system ATPase subunit